MTKRRRLTVGIGLALVMAALVGWSLVEARLLFVDRAIISSPDLPEEFDGARVVFLTDIHAGSMLGPGHVARMVDRVNQLEPDLVLIGGDYADGGAGGEAIVYPQLARIRAPLGKMAVFGNHEAPCPLPPGECEDRPGLQKAGVLLLENERARIRRGAGSIIVAGVGDFTAGETDIRAAASDVSPASFAILLSHNPDALPEGLPEVPGAFDLALTGHTHGGQITLFGLYAPVVPSQYGQRFRGGWSTVEGVPTLVSRGVGVFVVPMRFFAPPQIHLLELRRGPAGIER